MHQKVVENTVDEVDDYSASLQDCWNRKRAAASQLSFASYDTLDT